MISCCAGFNGDTTVVLVAEICARRDQGAVADQVASGGDHRRTLDGLPQGGAHGVGGGAGEAVRDDDAVDHVGEDRGPWTLMQPHRHRGRTAPPAERTLHAGEARWAAKGRCVEPAETGDVGNGAGRMGESE